LAIVGFNPGIDVSDPSPLEQTALLTEYARALDSRWPRPILDETLAAEVVDTMLDHRVRAVTAGHPDAVVVDLGAGLDSGVLRVGPPPTVDWYSVDPPT
jgi:O-methyltransferase involved in polyketide biosynthesis